MFHEYITSCVEIIVYWSKTFFITSSKENIVFVKRFERSFVSDILASLTKFQCHVTDIFGSIWV